jgi:hypothetical protein
MKANKFISSFLLTGTAALLTSCAATSTMIEHRNLEVSTNISENVFIHPAAPSQKTVFIAVKNLSSESLNIDDSLAKAFREKGYKVVTNSNQAHYLLLANIRQVGKMSQSASQSALGAGFGSVLAGAGTGVAIGALSNNSNAMIAGGLAGGLVSFAADSLVKAVNYTMITDVEISERVGKGAVQEQFNSNIKNGSSSGTTQTFKKSSDFLTYRTRVISNADKVNLAFAQARPALEEGLIKKLSSIF